jgi:DNA-directed RNA polymerase specialized sigma24 family protein
VKCEKLPHGHDLDDVVTDALSETAKALDRISGPQGILRYSVCVVRNLIRTLWKEEKSHPVASLPGDSAAIAHFQDQIDYEELTAGLAHGLGSSDLMLFQEWLEAGLNTREVRKQSRASESVFSTRFSRLRGKLRKSLRRRRTASDGPSSS